MYFKSIKPIRTQEPVHIENCLESADKAAAVSILDSLKTKTTLSYQNQLTGKQLINKMLTKGWLTDEDRKWAKEKLEMSI